MKKTFKVMMVFAAMLFSLGASAQEDNLYTNPVINIDFPDPTIINGGDGYFYAYCTNSRVKRWRSKDLVTWQQNGYAFTDTGRPRFVEGGGVWAPDINYINGQYVMYYSMSTWGGEWECGIGVATAPKANSQNFTDLGKLFISSEIGVQNSIDPFYIDADGKKYLFWGSFRGIYGIELSDDGLSLKEGAEKFRVAGTLTEGTYIHKRGDYYYLIGSAGSCCEGANSTYRLVVARSKNVEGPYVDKEGKSAKDNHFSEMLVRNEFIVGPGHCSEIVQDDAGQDWIMYHGYTVESGYSGRRAHLDQVLWDSEGWPYIVSNRPSNGAEKPIFGEAPQYTYSPVEYIEFAGDTKNMDRNFTYLYDTGYVPKKNTRIVASFQGYSADVDGNSTSGKWRAIYSGRNTYNDGYSLYQNNDGNKFGYFAGGYKNDYFAPYEFDTDFTVDANLSKVIINGKSYNTNRTDYNATSQRLTLFSGLQDYPFIGRIYEVAVYEGDNLVHKYMPMVREEDGVAVFHDTVDDRYFMPSRPYDFYCGEVIDAIKDVTLGNKDADAIYDLQGRKCNGNLGRGIYIKDGKKVLK